MTTMMCLMVVMARMWCNGKDGVVMEVKVHLVMIIMAVIMVVLVV